MLTTQNNTTHILVQQKPLLFTYETDSFIRSLGSNTIYKVYYICIVMYNQAKLYTAYVQIKPDLRKWGNKMY